MFISSMRTGFKKSYPHLWLLQSVFLGKHYQEFNLPVLVFWSLPSLFTPVFKDLFIWQIQRERKTVCVSEWEREIEKQRNWIHLLVYLPDGHKGKCYIRPKPAASFILVSHIGTCSTHQFMQSRAWSRPARMTSGTPLLGYSSCW